MGSSRGLECRGHRGGLYLPEPTPEDLERYRQEAEARVQAADAAKAAKAQQDYQTWDENRWFRTLLDQVPQAYHPGWATLPEGILQEVFSMLGDCIRVGNPSPAILASLKEASLPAIAEVRRRGLEWPVGTYDLDIPWVPTPTLDLSWLTDQEVQMWWLCASEVADYSCLNAGTRQTINCLWDYARTELERRGLEAPDFWGLD